MGVRIITDGSQAVMYCSTTDWAFGPVIMGDKEHDAVERAELFIQWLPQDARQYTDSELEGKWTDFRAVEDILWAKKQLVTEEEEN